MNIHVATSFICYDDVISAVIPFIYNAIQCTSLFHPLIVYINYFQMLICTEGVQHHVFINESTFNDSVTITDKVLLKITSPE